MLSRPWCLFELLVAIKHGIPIVPVNVCDPAHPYDYGAAACFLNSLDTELDRVNPGACAVLEEHGYDMVEVAYTLSVVVPDLSLSSSSRPLLPCSPV